MIVKFINGYYYVIKNGVLVNISKTDPRVEAEKQS